MCKCIIKYLCNDRNKWIIYNCTDNILNDMIEKQLSIIKIEFSGGYCNLKKPTEILYNGIQLQQLYVGYFFDQPIYELSNCTQLQHLTFGDYFSKPIDELDFFSKQIDTLYE